MPALPQDVCSKLYLLLSLPFLKKNSHLIVEQFLLEADVHGVERPSSARPFVFIWVHVKWPGLIRLFFFFYMLAPWILNMTSCLPRTTCALCYLTSQERGGGNNLEHSSKWKKSSSAHVSDGGTFFLFQPKAWKGLQRDQSTNSDFTDSSIQSFLLCLAGSCKRATEAMVISIRRSMLQLQN